MNDSYLAIDIGTGSIKAAEKSPDGEILRWGILERRGRPFHANIQPLSAEDAVKHLRVLLDRMRKQGPLTASEVVASVPSFAVFTAFAPEADARYIPAAAGTFELASIKLGEGWNFLYAAPRDLIEKYTRIFSGIGLSLSRLELENVVLAKSLVGVPERVLLVDVGYRSSSFTVAENGLPIFVDRVDFAVASGEKSEATRGYVRDVIMNKTKEIAANWAVGRIVSTGGPKGAFDIVAGLYL